VRNGSSLKIQDAKNRHFGTIAQLCRAVSSQLRHLSTIGKNLLSIDTSCTCPHNMVNFGLLTAEICCRVWGTPANFNGFRVLAVTARHSAALNRGRHLYSTGRPSRWALAHILVSTEPRQIGYDLSRVIACPARYFIDFLFTSHAGIAL